MTEAEMIHWLDEEAARRLAIARQYDAVDEIYAGHSREQGGRFVPYPATWLRARGWEDDDLQPAAVANGSAGGGWWFAQGYGSREAAVAAGAAP